MIAANRGYPVMLRMDNGPEFISLALAEWAEKHDVKLELLACPLSARSGRS